jgi:hypothetical protein
MITTAVWSIIQLQPPNVLPGDLPSDQFSAQRAGKHLEVLASQARPTGSDGNRQAQAYIIKQLTELGIEVKLDRQTVTSTRWGMPFDSATVANIIARLPARTDLSVNNSQNNTGANRNSLLLVCHYDTVPNSPGAADNGSGIAALLETARNLKFGAPLQNEILFLFTDAEESGALGAKAFVENYPQLNRIGLVVNFDARGNRGAAALFETTIGNGTLIREFAKATPHPIASSAFYEVAKLLGQSTDFRPLREAGLPGYNFVFSEGIAYYHTPLDNFDNLDKRSLQQQGEYALALARHFGNLPLGDLKTENVIFFNLGSYLLIIYPQYLTKPLAITILLLFIITVGIGYRNSMIKPTSVLLACCLFIGILAISASIITGVHWLISATSTTFQVMRTGDIYYSFTYRLAYISLGLGIILVLFKLAGRWLSIFNFAMGVAGIWLILMGISCWWFPGLSYLFTWPLLLLIVTINLFMVIKEARPAYLLITGMFITLPTIILLAPMPYLILVALQLTRANVAVISVGLICGLLLIYWQLLLNSLRWYLPGLLITTATILFVIATVTSGFSSTQPQPTSLTYFLDTTANKAYWLSEDRRANNYTSQFNLDIGEKDTAKDLFPDNSLWVSRNTAPLINDLKGPKLTVIADKTENGRRRITMSINSARNAQWLFIFVTSQTEIISTEINGQEVKDPIISQPITESCWGFRHMNISPDGLTWNLEIKETDQPVEIVLIDQSFSLPATLLARTMLPAKMMVARSWIANSTLVRTTEKL